MKRVIAILLIIVLFAAACGGSVNTDVSDQIRGADSIEAAARVAVEEGRQAEPSVIRAIRFNPAAEILNIELMGDESTVSEMHGEARIIFERLKLRDAPDMVIISYWFPAASGGGDIQGMRIEFDRSNFRNTDFAEMLPHNLPESASEYFLHHELQ